MGRLEFRVDARDDDPGRSISDSITHAMKGALKEITRDMKMDAIEKLIADGAPWPDVKSDFHDQQFTQNGELWTVVWNESEHAKYVEGGATWDTEGPPVAVLIDWTEANFGGKGRYYPGWDVVDDVANTFGISKELASHTLYVQRAIKGGGREGVHFMARARRNQRKNAAKTVADHIERKT